MILSQLCVFLRMYFIFKIRMFSDIHLNKIKRFFFLFRNAFFGSHLTTSIKNQKLISKFRYFRMKNCSFRPAVCRITEIKLRCHFVWVKNCGSLLEQRQIINITTTAANIPNISTPLVFWNTNLEPRFINKPENSSK